MRCFEADVVVLNIESGTNYHALDFFLMTDNHLAVRQTMRKIFESIAREGDKNTRARARSDPPSSYFNSCKN